MNYIPPDSLPSSELVRIAMTPHVDEIVDMTEGDIRSFPIRERFRAIHHIKERVLRENKAPQNDPKKPIPSDRIVDEVIALTKISGSMKHSPQYLEWLDRCRLYLFVRLCADKKLKRLLESWPELKPADKKFAMRRREEHHAIAARKTLRVNITKTDIQFIDNDLSPEDLEETPLRAHASASGFVGATKAGRLIKVSMHPKSIVHTAHGAMGIGHHEKKHDIGLQQAGLLASGDKDKLGNLVEDAKLWYHLREERATIPSRIRAPYYSQFHEHVAREEQRKMSDFILEMLKPGFVPPSL